jgi:hypothetical protein
MTYKKLPDGLLSKNLVAGERFNAKLSEALMKFRVTPTCTA